MDRIIRSFFVGAAIEAYERGLGTGAFEIAEEAAWFLLSAESPQG